MERKALFSIFLFPLLLSVISAVVLAQPVRAQVISFQLDRGGLVATDTFSFDWGATTFTLAPRFGYYGPDKQLRLDAREAFLDWKPNETWDVTVGRKIVTYGPGRYGSPILGALGSHPANLPNYTPVGEDLWAEGYDQAGYAFTWKKLNYHKFYANVSEEGNFRALLGQRATLEWGPFTFGASEIALLHDGAPGLMYLPIPFVPVYFYQYAASSYYHMKDVNDTANIATDFDIVWRPTAHTNYYFMYYMDDRPWPRKSEGWAAPKWDEWPWRVGYQVGMCWLEPFHSPGWKLYLEYTRIDDYTYVSPYSGELSYRGWVIGDPLGPDADRVNLELVRHPEEAGEWSLIFVRERHGEGRLGDEWSYIPGRTEVFLSGVVETTYLVAAKFPQDWGPVKMQFTIGLKHVDNNEHRRGSGETGLVVGLSGRYPF